MSFLFLLAASSLPATGDLSAVFFSAVLLVCVASFWVSFFFFLSSVLLVSVVSGDPSSVFFAFLLVFAFSGSASSVFFAFLLVFAFSASASSVFFAFLSAFAFSEDCSSVVFAFLSAFAFSEDCSSVVFALFFSVLPVGAFFAGSSAIFSSVSLVFAWSAESFAVVFFFFVVLASASAAAGDLSAVFSSGGLLFFRPLVIFSSWSALSFLSLALVLASGVSCRFFLALDSVSASCMLLDFFMTTGVAAGLVLPFVSLVRTVLSTCGVLLPPVGTSSRFLPLGFTVLLSGVASSLFFGVFFHCKIGLRHCLEPLKFFSQSRIRGSLLTLSCSFSFGNYCQCFTFLFSLCHTSHVMK